MTPEEMLFNELLSRLENSDRYPLNTADAETLTDHLTSRDIEIGIMKSEEIFYQGRLKGGRKANVGKRQYNSYQINDLENLVRVAAISLFFWIKNIDLDGDTPWVAGLFDQLFKYYDTMAATVLFIGTVKENTISDNRKVIEGWRNKTLKRIQLKRYQDVVNIKEDLAKLFIAHVPKAPPSRIAKVVGVLLSMPPFNMIVNIDTLRKDVKIWT